MHIAPCKGQAYKVADQLSCFCRPLTPGIKAGQPLQLAHCANERSLRQVCSRLQSRAGSNETSFRIPDADGFMGLPLQQTQKLDPKDPANFWKQHAPPSGRSAEFWGTEEGHSLLVEWDNGARYLCHINKQPALAGRTARQMGVPLRNTGLLWFCRSICNGRGLLHNSSLPKRHRAAHDSLDHGQQHPGTCWLCSSRSSS